MIQMQKKIFSLKEGMEEFVTDCKVRNLTQDTINYYNESFISFENFLKQTYKNFNVSTDTKKDLIDKYIIYMQNKNLKDTTINIKLRGIRSILYFLMKNDYIEHFEIKLLKEDDPIPDLYTNDEIRKLLKKPNLKKCTFAEYRTWAIINFFIGTGVRSRTLRFVQTKDLDFENDLIKLTTTKGRKMIFIPMSTSLKKVLLEYLKIRGGTQEDYLFCNLEGKQLTRHALGNIVSKYNKSRGIEKTGIHLFRHFFAKNYIQNGGNALKLQKLLAHRTLAQTQKYVDLYGQDLQKDYDKFNPLDNLCANSERIKMRAS